MSKSIKAAADIRSLANLYKNMNAAADALEAIGSLEQAENETRSRLEKLRAEAEQLKVANSESDKYSADLIADARRKAEELLSEANVKALEAKEDADEHLEFVKRNVADITREAQELAAQCREEAAAAQKARDEANADLAEIEKKVEKAKAYLQKLAG